jgi:hypothetical protein
VGANKRLSSGPRNTEMRASVVEVRLGARVLLSGDVRAGKYKRASAGERYLGRPRTESKDGPKRTSLAQACSSPFLFSSLFLFHLLS